VAVYKTACFFFSSRRRHTRSKRDWSSDVCSSDLARVVPHPFFLHWHESALKRGTFWKQEAHVALSWLVVKKEEPSQAVKDPLLRSEERRVGKECRFRWSRELLRKGV